MEAMAGSMTELLEKAIAEVCRLPKDEQDAVARWLISELASERRWEEALGASVHRLAELAREAVSEYQAGETEKLDPDGM